MGPPTIATGGVGTYSAISIGSDALPVISSRNTATGALTVVHCDDVACAGGGESRVDVDDPANLVGRDTSVSVGVDGFPVVSYVDETTQRLKVAHCANVFCTPYTRAR